MNHTTQRQMILTYMQTHGSITALDAIRVIGCTKLATRVSEMIAAGYPIIKEPEIGKDRWGQPVRYMRYRLGGMMNG